MTPEDRARKTVEDAAVFREGMNTEFWRRLESLLDDLRARSIDALLDVPPDDRGQIAELQQAAKIGSVVKNTMIDIISEAEEMSRQ